MIAHLARLCWIGFQDEFSPLASNFYRAPPPPWTRDFWILSRGALVLTRDATSMPGLYHAWDRDASWLNGVIMLLHSHLTSFSSRKQSGSCGFVAFQKREIQKRVDCIQMHEESPMRKKGTGACQTNDDAFNEEHWVAPCQWVPDVEETNAAGD